jgi:hypothetical protein
MLSIFICLATVISGWRYPKFVGWFFLLLAPILVGFDGLVINHDPVFPLRFNQLFFSASFGVFLAENNRARIYNIFTQLLPAKLFALFIAAEVLVFMFDPSVMSFKQMLLHKYPVLLGAFIMPAALLRTLKDQKIFCYSLFASAGFIFLMALIELCVGYNLAHHLCALNFEECNINNQHWAPLSISWGEYVLTSGMRLCERFVGYIGEPNRTAIFLAMFMVFGTFFFVEYTNERLICLAVSFILIAMGLILWRSQVRAAIFSFIFASIIPMFYKREIIKYYLIIILTALGVLVIILSNDLCKTDVIYRLKDTYLTLDGERTEGSRMALHLFINSYGLGLGGGIYDVALYHLKSNDVSSYIIYFLTGGVLLGLLHFGSILFMIIDLFRKSIGSDKMINNTFVFLAACSIFIGFLTQFFNNNELQFIIWLIYVSAAAPLTKGSRVRRYNGPAAGKIKSFC